MLLSSFSTLLIFTSRALCSPEVSSAQLEAISAGHSDSTFQLLRRAFDDWRGNDELATFPSAEELGIEQPHFGVEVSQSRQQDDTSVRQSLPPFHKEPFPQPPSPPHYTPSTLSWRAPTITQRSSTDIETHHTRLHKTKDTKHPKSHHSKTPSTLHTTTRASSTIATQTFPSWTTSYTTATTSSDAPWEPWPSHMTRDHSADLDATEWDNGGWPHETRKAGEPTGRWGWPVQPTGRWDERPGRPGWPVGKEPWQARETMPVKRTGSVLRMKS